MPRSENLFKESTEAILNCLDFSILVIDQNRIIKFANQALATELRLERPAIIGQTCHKICHNLPRPCRPSEVNCPVALLQTQEEPLGIVHNHITAADENDIVYVSAIALKIGGKPHYLCLSIPVNGRRDDTVSAQKTRRLAIKTILDALEGVT